MTRVPRGRPGEQPADAELAHFFEQSFDLHCVAGLDGYFRRLNPAWESALGWTVEELLARPFIAFVHADDREATLRETAWLTEGAETIRFENRYACKDGSYRWLEWNAKSVTCGGEIYATARDITDGKRLEREVLDILDGERERLGRELHDGLCQTLAGISALSSTLSRRLARSEARRSTADGQAAGAELAAEITGLLRNAIVQVRDMARDLGPVDLRQLGLATTLEALALSVQRSFPLSCTFACGRPLGRLGHEVERHVFRIAQQAVHNAVAHGKGDRIEILLGRGTGSRSGKGLLTVRDNGAGLPEGSRHPDGVGLHTMAYRAHLIGGRIEVRQRSRGGTVAQCAFPLTGRSDGKEARRAKKK